MTGAYAKQPPTKIMNHPGVCAVDGCDRKYYAKLHCRLHWERLYMNGTTERAHIAPGTPAGERLERLSERVGECIEFTGYRDKNGYGSLTIDGVYVRAHRLAFEIAHGEVPEGLFVRHKCDNPPCINPDHLESGTPADNMRDKAERVRAAKGTDNAAAKLTDADVRRIRALRSAGWTYGELSALFDVGNSTVGRVVRGSHWKHVE